MCSSDLEDDDGTAVVVVPPAGDRGVEGNPGGEQEGEEGVEIASHGAPLRGAGRHRGKACAATSVGQATYRELPRGAYATGAAWRGSKGRVTKKRRAAVALATVALVDRTGRRLRTG